MTTPVTDAKKPEAEAPKPAPKPSTAPAAAAKAAVKDVATGLHPMRPVKYATGFVNGTVRGTLDGMAKWGRKGSYWGLGLGALAAISGAATGGLSILAIGFIGGLAAGAVTGGAVGLVTGGARGVTLEHRKVQYADDLEARAKAKARGTPQSDYRNDLRDHHTTQSNYFVDRIFQQNREISQQVTQESRGYFQDMVHHSRMGHQHGQGF